MQGTTMTSFMASRPPLTEPEQNLQCPRCESTNTKFCYYNNYNLSQPRHFCKDCRRYWTKGGTLRNVPVGGGTRKNSKRSLSSSGGINSKRPSPSSSSGELKNSDFFSSSIPTVENDHRMLDMNGSFSSLLSSTAQFGNFFECFQSIESSEAAAAPPAMPENFLSLPGDTSSWADLSIYSAPGRNFQ